MFAGLISKEQPVSAWGDADKILAALAPYSLDKPRDCWATDKLLLLQVATRNDATSAEIYRHTESGVAVAFWGRLDNRPDLIAQLDAEHKSSDDELIALAWLKWGEYCPEKLIGDFAFAVASPKTGVVFLARDVMGVKPLFYRTDEQGIFFASTVAAFKPLKFGTLTRSREWMAKFLLEISVSHTETAYLEIKKLPGAHCLLIYADGRLNIRRYHQFVDDAPVESKCELKYLEVYRAAWQEAVACRMPASGNFGTENSGGLDSGSITSEIARQLDSNLGRLHALGFCHHRLEPPLIMSTAMKFGIHNNFIVSRKELYDLDEVQSRELEVAGYPSEHSNASYHIPFYEYSKLNGISVLFSGYGGDEAVTTEWSQFRTEFLLTKNYSALWHILPGMPWLKPLRFVKAILFGPAVLSQQESAMAYWHELWPYQLLRKDIIATYNLQRLYFSAAKFHKELPSVNEYVLYMVQRAFAPVRLEVCALMASSFGVDYVWPLWDQRLIQQWLSTPSIWKVGSQGQDRFLHRIAVAGVCPDDVTWLRFKDMGYSEVQDKLNGQSLLEDYQNLDTLLRNMPMELMDIFDIDKAFHTIRTGMEQDRRGKFEGTVLATHIERIGALIAWIEFDKKISRNQS